jgi:hypothetical protein
MKRARAKKKGQSTVEYLVLMAVVIAVLITFMRPGGSVQRSVNQGYAVATNRMNVASDMIFPE